MVSVAARAAFVIAALAVLAAAFVTLADVVMRQIVGAPIRAAHEYVEAAITIAVLLGAPGALHLYRDPAIPPGPDWLGRAGTAAALLVLAAFAALILHILYEKFGFKDDGERSIDAKLPTTLIALLPLYVCFALLLLTQLSLTADIALGTPTEAPLSWALMLGLAAVLGWAAARGIESTPATFPALLVSTAGGISSLALPVLAVGAIGGAIAALRPATGVAAVAAPLTTATLVAISVDASISKAALALVVPAIIVAVLHAALGAWRGWRGMADDLIGLGILLVTALFLVPGMFTPSEFTSVFALILVGILVLIALILQPAGGVSRPLARGLAYGIGAVFAFLMFLLLANAAAAAGIFRDAAAPDIVSGPLGFVICLALGVGLGALLGNAIGCLLTALLVAALVRGAIDPVLMACLVVLTTLAGAAFHPWLARRFAGGAPPSDCGLTLRSAVLAALPPAVAAALIWFAPDLALQLPRALVN